MSDPKRVQGPDGKLYEFPADMEMSRIDEIMRQQYPSKPKTDPRQAANIQFMRNSLPSGLGQVASLLPESAQSRIASAQQGIVQGGTFGFSDEIVGGLRALSPNVTYKDAVAQQRQSQEAAKEANPVSYIGGEILGGGATGGAGLARQGVIKASTPVGASISGALGGGAYGAGTAEGNVLERADEAAIGAGLGAAGGFVLEKVGRGIQNLVQSDGFLVNGALTDKARQLISSTGINPDDFTPEQLQALAQRVRKGTTPDEAARIQAAESLPVQVPLTTGQRTNNPDALRLEANAFDGRMGDKALGIAEGARRQQQLALQDNAQAIRQQLTGREAVPTQEGGVLASNRIQSEAQDALETAVSVRDRAKKGVAFAPRDIVKDLSSGIQQRLKTGVDALSDDEINQVTGSLINPAKRILDANKGELSVNALIGLRRTISEASSSAKGSAKTVLGDAVSQLDNALNDAVENALITGDKEAVKAWSKSTKLFADYYKRYAGKDGARRMIAKMASGDIEPEEVSRVLFGARGVRQSNRGLSLARELKGELGANSAEWQSLRGEALGRLFQDVDGRDIGLKFSSELERALTDHPAIMRELFDPEEVRLLRQFGKVTRLVNAQARSTANPSRSGDLLNFMNRMGGGALIDLVRGLPILREVAQSIAEGGNARKVKKLVNPK